MQYITETTQPIETGFNRQMQQESQTHIWRCYQCFTCTLSCPSSFAMDYLPHQIVRMLQLDLKQQVLHSRTIWVCADCKACAARCPNEIDIPALMDALRQMALRESKPSERNIVVFHKLFLSNIAKFGRQHELSLVLKLKLRTGDLLSGLNSGAKMFFKGKLSIVPPKRRDSASIRAIFRKAGSHVR